MNRHILSMSFVLLCTGSVAEEESIMFGASVSEIDIFETTCPDPNVFIGSGFKSGIETTSYMARIGSSVKEFQIDLKKPLAIHTVYLGSCCQSLHSHSEMGLT